MTINAKITGISHKTGKIIKKSAIFATFFISIFFSVAGIYFGANFCRIYGTENIFHNCAARTAVLFVIFYLVQIFFEKSFLNHFISMAIISICFFLTGFETTVNYHFCGKIFSFSYIITAILSFLLSAYFVISYFVLSGILKVPCFYNLKNVWKKVFGFLVCLILIALRLFIKV